MKHTIALLLLFLPTFTFAGVVQKTKHIELSAIGIDMLVMNCGAGTLDLQRVEGLHKISVAAEVETEDVKNKDLQKLIEKDVHLNLIKQGSKALLISEIPKNSFKNVVARINLAVEIPKNVDVKIVDGSGPIRIKGLIGNLNIDDGSGNIIIENIVGKVTVNDGSGSILIEDIKGNLMVKDGSGFIDADYIKGDVYVTDGSGDMAIRHIDGNVTVSDASGDIYVSDVSKNVFVSETGSGKLDTERIKGKVTIRE